MYQQMQRHLKTLFIIASTGALLACQTTPDLGQRWSALKTEKSDITARDAATELKVSEAELLATGIGSTVVRLQDGPDTARKIMRRALDLGEVMALTRNDAVVIERTGVASRLKPAQEPKPTGDAAKDAENELRSRDIVGGYLGGAIDLRFTFSEWKYAFASVTPGRQGKMSRSLQFFDASGMAVHKIYLRNEPGIAVFDKLVNDFRNPRQSAKLGVVAAAPQVADRPDSAVDVKELRLAWNELTDVHQFPRLLKEFKVSREQALRLAPPGVAEHVTAGSLRNLLDGAAANKVAIMAFVGNPGLTQIFSGKIEKVEQHGKWYNVLDPEFNLHVLEPLLARGWVIQRAGLSSVEYYDVNGKLAVTFFGVRERNQPQPADWTALTKTLPRAK